MSLKILMIPSAYHPANGGSEASCKSISEELSRKGYDVFVVTPDVMSSEGLYDPNIPFSGHAETETLNNVQIIRVKYFNYLQKLTLKMIINSKPRALMRHVERTVRKYIELCFAWKLNKILEKISPDYVITLPHLHLNVRVAINICLKRKIPCGYYPLLHENDPGWPTDQVRRFLQKVSHVYAVTQYEADRLESIYKVPKEKVHFTGLGADLKIENTAKESHKNHHEKIILFLGRKTASKGIDELIDAMRIVQSNRSDCNLALVGAVARDTVEILSRAIQHINPTLITIRDDVSDNERNHWLASCSVLVLPSKIESFGTVILEAWLAKKPVIVAKVPVFQEIVTDGVNGILYDGIDDLVSALLFVMDNPAAAARMGEAGYRQTIEEHNWKKVVSRIESSWGSDGIKDRPPIVGPR